VLCRPLTGRMHQIRVHLAARGWPIVGDPVYGPRSIDDAVGDRDPAACPDPRPAEGPATAPTGCRGTGIRIGRQALHAWRVSLAHPVTGRPLVITAPLPSDMVALLDCLGIGQHQPRE
jgi:23S rRNA pseudouridine1911/1915/1917 synthase